VIVVRSVAEMLPDVPTVSDTEFVAVPETN
jgi:hypothetical protein